LNCFRGAGDDVAGRFLSCAEEQGWEFAVRINGDNLFADPTTLGRMVAIAETGAFDFVTNVPGRSFPFGMSVEILRTAFYRDVMASVDKPEYREHVTSLLYDRSEIGRRHVYRNRIRPEASGVQLALDTPEDLVRLTELMGRMRSPPLTYGLAEIGDLLAEAPVESPWKGRAGPLLIAEIGGNHEGNFDVARKMTELAIGSGVDCIKFQIYRGDTLVSPVESPDRHKHFQRFELSLEQHVELARMCQAAGVAYVSSVWDLEMLEPIDSYMPFYKIGSGDLTAWPILAQLAARGKPILLSTGLATMDDVLQTVRRLQAFDARYRRPEWLCLLQCTSMYPIPDSDANLRVMEALRAATGLAVGYSDHTVGSAALCAAAALGAEVLEFHFTDTREGKTFRDHKISLTTDEVGSLVKQISRITELRGVLVKEPTPSEIEHGHVTSFRRAVFPKRSIKAGEIIQEEDLVVLRPDHGTDARDIKRVIGARAIRDLLAFQALHPKKDYEKSN
jgi:N-acetylneuraminate synthase/N,N'-diacetyllegionaminate synthase